MPRPLSIIIPCYNCESTLRKAVDSCFRQGLDAFEIVMVDDGSTDGTFSVMEKIAQEHAEVHISSHDQNKGGGATRNTAVTLTKNDTVFCLDSDDILGDGTLASMLHFLEEKECDGVGISQSIKFRGTDISSIEEIHNFMRPGELIVLNDLLEQGGLCSLYSTFMFTKSAFERAGGYPTQHGFDTQGFAWRFLAVGNTAYTCPDAKYFHRVYFSQSYYLREANSGRVNFNWFDILDEHFYLFSKPTQLLLLSFNYKDTGQDIFDRVRAEEKSFASRVREDYRTELEARKLAGLDAIDSYWLGCEYLREKKYEEAESFLIHSLSQLDSDQTKEKIYSLSLFRKGLDENKIRNMVIAKRIYASRNSLRGLFYRIKKRIRSFIQSNEPLKKSLVLYYLAYDVYKRTKARHSLSLIVNLFTLEIQKLFRYKFNTKCLDKEFVFDVVIPTVTKDQDLLSEYLTCLRKNLCGAIRTIYVVAPDEEFIRKFCTRENVVFINEQSVLGYGKDSIEYAVNGVNRNGWLFQQLLKLSGDQFISDGHYVIVDSDTLLIKPHSFYENGKQIFLESSEWNEAYFRTFEKLFGYEAPTRRSFTAHMMIFEITQLKKMKKEIEQRFGISWDKAYIETTDKTNLSGISDYDTYANWLLYNHPEEMKTKPFYNKSLPRKKLEEMNVLIQKYGSKFASLSFHSYNI